MRDKVKILPIKQQLKWCNILQLPSDTIDWSNIYKNNYYATNETKLRSFQIRLNLRSIVTKIQLCVLDITSDNLCTFCGEEPETLIHLFCDCKIVDAFWNDVFHWILARFRINVPSNNFHKLFGFHTQYANNPLVNHMLLLARFLIYRCKHSNTTPNMPQYFNAITCTKNQNTILLRNIINWNFITRNGLATFRHCIMRCRCFYSCVLVFVPTIKKKKKKNYHKIRQVCL